MPILQLLSPRAAQTERWTITCKTSHKNDSLPGEVPNGNCASNNKLLASKNELGRPEQSNQVDPPKLSSESTDLIMNTFETSRVADERTS